MNDLTMRQELIDTALESNACGVNQGMSGNVSVRTSNGFLITPSGMQYNHLKPNDIAFMDMNGNVESARVPSSEWRFHLDIYRGRSDTNAIVHTHSVHATALACLNRSIPAFHYMVAVAGGNDIRCAKYATFGTQALSDFALEALKDRKACLLAHHGVIAVGHNLSSALALACEVETLAHQYLTALSVGEPEILSAEEMNVVVEKFSHYGEQVQK